MTTMPDTAVPAPAETPESGRRQPLRPRRALPSSLLRRLCSRRQGTVLAWSLAAVFFALYAALSVRDQQLMITGGYDLGLFDEVVRAYSHGHMPDIALKGFDELGDHFSPIWVLAAPFYLVVPSVFTVLLVQAALFAVGVVPLVGWAARTSGRPTAVVVGVGYGLSWGIASAAGFDVHEVAFAVPMLSYSAVALGQRRWRAAAAWALPLLLVKEDLGFTLAAIGVYIALHGARRLGAATVAVGVVGSILEIKVLIPAFNPHGMYGYDGKISGAFSGGLPHAVIQFITPEVKVVTVALLLAVTGFSAVRSPIVLLIIPTLGWRFLSTNQSYWGTGYQYSAVLMPLVFAAFVHALANLNESSDRRQAVAIRRTALASSLVFTAALLAGFPLWTLTKSSMWHTPARIAVARQVIAEIPENATVTTGNQLVPQLTDRDTVSLLEPPTPQSRPAWVLIDTESPTNFPLAPGQQATIISQLRGEGYRTIDDRDGYLLLER